MPLDRKRLLGYVETIQLILGVTDNIQSPSSVTAQTTEEIMSPAGKGLTSLLLFVMFNCVFVTFPCDILGQAWYLIVSIPDLCRLSYFHFVTGPQGLCFMPHVISWVRRGT